MNRNNGSCPPELRGTDRRVHVVLRNGYDTRKSLVDKAGWRADTGRRENTRWHRTGDPFDILEWEQVK